MGKSRTSLFGDKLEVCARNDKLGILSDNSWMSLELDLNYRTKKDVFSHLKFAKLSW